MNIPYSIHLTNRQFSRFSKLVYHECGINLHEGKRQLLQARLAKRLRYIGIDSVEAYLDHIENDDEERVHFLDAISTNHTYFFRESQHFECLKDAVSHIWCAAVSSGEEAYSVAIDCMEKGFKPMILATDISTHMLRLAERGIYGIEKVKGIPHTLLRKYFQKGQGKWEGYIKIKNEVKKIVTFGRYNLLTDPIPSSEFDVIFCRNVLIYFDHITKIKVVNRLYGSLKPGGHFIIGGAESLNNITHPYKYVRPSIYVK
jgi:chemotaxis protein methyltransferase CheR